MNVSVVCAVMNRPYRVIPCLRSWVDLKIANDVVVVDWSSDKQINDIIAEEEFNHSKLTVVRVDNQEKFNFGRAYNIAIDRCESDIVVKVDIDYILTNQVKLTEVVDGINFDKQFLHGGGTGAHYLGFSCFDKTHGERYNENFNGYGYEDGDLYKRFQNIGLEKMIIPDIREIFYHIPHDNRLRVQNFDVKDIAESTKNNMQIADTNDE